MSWYFQGKTVKPLYDPLIIPEQPSFHYNLGYTTAIEIDNYNIFNNNYSVQYSGALSTSDTLSYNKLLIRDSYKDTGNDKGMGCGATYNFSITAALKFYRLYQYGDNASPTIWGITTGNKLYRSLYGSTTNATTYTNNFNTMQSICPIDDDNAIIISSNGSSLLSLYKVQIASNTVGNPLTIVKQQNVNIPPLGSGKSWIVARADLINNVIIIKLQLNGSNKYFDYPWYVDVNTLETWLIPSRKVSPISWELNDYNSIDYSTNNYQVAVMSRTTVYNSSTGKTDEVLIDEKFTKDIDSYNILLKEHLYPIAVRFYNNEPYIIYIKGRTSGQVSGVYGFYIACYRKMKEYDHVVPVITYKINLSLSFMDWDDNMIKCNDYTIASIGSQYSCSRNGSTIVIRNALVSTNANRNGNSLLFQFTK